MRLSRRHTLILIAQKLAEVGRTIGGGDEDSPASLDATPWSRVETTGPRNETTPRAAETARRREFGQFPLTRPLAFTLRVKDTDMKDKAGERKAEKKKTSVVRLDDLAPRQDVVGGAGKLVFGEGVVGDRGARDRAPRAERSRGREPKTRD